MNKIIAIVLFVLLGFLSATQAQDPTTKPPVYGAYPPNSEVCYEGFGCFSNIAPFNNTGNYLPINPSLINPEFLVFSRANKDNEFVVNYKNLDSIRDSKFDPKKELKFIIHGFQNNRTTKWITTLKNALLQNGDFNVIAADWGDGAVFPHYNNASSNTRIVGRIVCQLIKRIQKIFYESNPNNLKIHCIGHSLGAHTCGYASTECGSTFDRISAMDPAGPFFEDTDPLVRVDPSDARFVDVTHSNGGNLLSGSFGLVMPTGHVDYYPNGGKSQPGCPGVAALIGGIFGSNGLDPSKEVSCSHNRAIGFFIESINPSAHFTAYPCSSYDAFMKGDCFKCDGQCGQLGYYSNQYKARGSYYLATSDKSPYAGTHHFLEFSISSQTVKTAGDVYAFIYTKSENITKILATKDESILPNNVVQKVLTVHVDLGEIEEVELYFEKKPKVLFSAEVPPKFFFDKIKIRNVEIDEAFSFCSAGTLVEDRQIVRFKLNEGDCSI